MLPDKSLENSGTSIVVDNSFYHPDDTHGTFDTFFPDRYVYAFNESCGTLFFMSGSLICEKFDEEKPPRNPLTQKCFDRVGDQGDARRYLLTHASDTHIAATAFVIAALSSDGWQIQELHRRQRDIS